MSDLALCDGCGKRGKRRRMYPCPAGWFYIASTDQDDGETYYVYACSEACKAAVWHRGPGLRFPLSAVTP